MKNIVYSAAKLLFILSVLSSNAPRLNPLSVSVAKAASTPLPEGHPKIDPHGSAAPTGPKLDFSKIVKPKGGKTVQEIYQEKNQLNGKRVTLRGKVVKYNQAIMGKNWLHLRDGTGKEPTNDLTVTSQMNANVGDTVLVEGIVRLDKNLGSGYQYDVIIEDAKVKVE